MVSVGGHAWLAKASREERDKALNQVKALHPKLYTERIAQVRQARRDAAERGYCTSAGYMQERRLAVAVPMARAVNGETVMFNCTTSLKGRKSPPTHVELGARLITLVRSVEVALGIA